MLQDVELTGSRVKLVPLDPTHIDGLFAAGQDPQIWRYLPIQVAAKEDMVALVLEALEEKSRGSQLPFTVFDLTNDRIVGSTRFLLINEPNKNLEIGWTWYSSDVWRTDVNSECKFLLLTYCFEVLGYVRVQLKTDVRNERSNQAIQRIGAKYEGTLRNDRILPDGYIRNSNLYSIIDSEWATVKHNFQSKLLRTN
ncbi:GNAT family N-acetyltransferase [Paenibacillus piri]|uniref:N-acetyltransferase n=1 Tax=Paenibacillus piri TaxID=2547395 RepID=A0A4R5KI23_9BACL|nr:GNAT family protein [Paenibacillus piri]TDF95026.1 N-acetyltransferase [Paenibacillus piri]